MIPHILQQYRTFINHEHCPLSREIVLRGGEHNLESLLRQRRINEGNYLRILERIFLFSKILFGWSFFQPFFEPELKRVRLFKKK